MSFQAAATAAGLDPLLGKQAMENRHRQQIKEGGGTRVVGSVDLDGHFQRTEPEANRWDYAVGFRRSKEFAVWIEAHPASSPQDVGLVIRKLGWLKGKLRKSGFRGLARLTELAPAASRYCWLYQGSCRFRAGGKEQRVLAKHGMRLPSRWLEI